MASGITTSGFRRFARRLDATAAAMAAAPNERWVGTAVWYAHFSEFGTSREPERRWMRDGLREAASDWNAGSLIRRKFKRGERTRSHKRRATLVSALWSPDEDALEPLAQAAAENARRNIVRSGLRDSGDLERSVAVGVTIEDLVRESSSRVRDPRNVA